MNDDVDAVAGDDDELDFDVDLDEPEVEPEAVAEPEAAPVEEPAAQEDVAAQALAAVKETWADLASEKYPLADLGSIGLTGIDRAAREQFMAAAKADNDAKIEALKKQGFVYDPSAAGEAQVEASEQALAAQWGAPVGGHEPTMDEKVAKAVEENVRAGDMTGTIQTLISGGKLGDFFFKGKK